MFSVVVVVVFAEFMLNPAPVPSLIPLHQKQFSVNVIWFYILVCCNCMMLIYALFSH